MTSSPPECPTLIYFGAPDENCSHFAPFIVLEPVVGGPTNLLSNRVGCQGCKMPLRKGKLEPSCFGCQRKRMFERAHVSFFDATSSVPIGTGTKPFTARSSRLYSELVDDIYQHEDFWCETKSDSPLVRASPNFYYSAAGGLFRLCQEHERYGNFEEADRVWKMAFRFQRRHNMLAEELGDVKALASDKRLLYEFWQNELNIAVLKDETERAVDAFHTLVGLEGEQNMPLKERTYTKVMNIRLTDSDGKDSTHEMAGDMCMKWHATMALLHQGASKLVKGPSAKEEDRMSMCGVCGVKAGKNKLMRCSRCQSIWYCGRDCQMHDWKDHMAECKAIQLRLKNDA